MTELCCEYLSVRCILLYVIIKARTSFRVNPHSKIKAVTKMDDYCTICQCKTEGPKNIEISAPISIEVWLF